MNKVFYNTNEYDYKSEFEYILKTYIFKLLGLTNKNFDNVSNEELKTLICGKIIQYKNEKLYFWPKKSLDYAIKISINKSYANIDYSIEENVLKTLLKLSHNKELNSDRKNKYNTIEQCKSNYNYAIEMGLCKALIGNEIISENLYSLISILSSWSKKTYEGKKVSFAFIINRRGKAKEDAINYLEFLKTDFSATITDGITSIIELDADCKYMKYHSVSNKEEGRLVGGSLKDKVVPLRFLQIVNNFVEGDKIGVFLLVNGDILLAKNKEILYAKRNDQWINFSSERFSSILDDLNIELNLTEEGKKEFFKEIYSTALDVSFSHAGGIISVVQYERLSESRILNISDNLFDNSLDNQLKKQIIEEYKKNYNRQDISMDSLPKNLELDMNMRFLKRNVLKNLLEISDSKKNIQFVEIDRKLRAELVGLDGATIINESGDIVSFGAIIKNDAGSSAGGRGAAAKKLSSYKGFSIKISTDGYIELYVDREIKYQIK